MPRPTLERTLRYMPVVPRASSKLAKEARRGSHDLRRLVGHANFLDTLMYELDVGSVEEETKADEEPTTAQLQTITWSDLQNDAEWETESSEDEDEAITPEFDHENDEEHALGRVQSHVVDKAPVHTISVTPERRQSIAGSEEALKENELAPDASEGGGEVVQIMVPELDVKAEEYFDKPVVQNELVVAAKA